MRKLTFDNYDGEILFEPCRFDGGLQESRNPFTGQPVEVPRNGLLTADEQRGVEAILHRARTPEFSNVVKAPDGGMAEFDVGPSSLLVKPRRTRPTPGLASLLFDVLVAGRWCIHSDDALVVSNVEHARQRPQEDPRVPAEFYETYPTDVVVVETANALATALAWNVSDEAMA